MQQQMQQANTVDPNIQRLMGLNNAIIDWHTNPNNTVKDIYKHPTLGDKLPVFQLMKKNQDAGRVGRGVVGRTNINKEGYADDTKLEDDFDRSIAAGGALEMGLQGELNDAEDNVGKLTALDSNRRSGQVANVSNMYGMSKDLASRISQGGWGGFLRSMAGGVMGSI